VLKAVTLLEMMSYTFNVPMRYWTLSAEGNIELKGLKRDYAAMSANMAAIWKNSRLDEKVIVKACQRARESSEYLANPGRLYADRRAMMLRFAFRRETGKKVPRALSPYRRPRAGIEHQNVTSPKSIYNVYDLPSVYTSG